jgi:hypothetical protein
LLDDTLTPYEFAMEDVNVALLRVERALTADDPDATAQACSEVRLTYRRVKHLCSKLRLEPEQRDSLIGQLSLLEARLQECEKSVDRFTAVRRRR